MMPAQGDLWIILGLPPANSFWSVTMYGDASLTTQIQKDSLGKEPESNWLPEPDGPIYVVLRLYWSKASALKGSWKPPTMMQNLDG
jgi:hypothetical protein